MLSNPLRATALALAFLVAPIALSGCGGDQPAARTRTADASVDATPRRQAPPPQAVGDAFDKEQPHPILTVLYGVGGFLLMAGVIALMLSGA